VIRRILLRNWRAYDQLDLELTRPVTFLVAANGVGKSSLVEAVRWAILGTPSDRDRGRAVRSGEDTATVTVHLDLTTSEESGRHARTAASSSQAHSPSSATIEVTRTLRRNGTSTFAASMAGEQLPEEKYLAILTHAWTADAGLLDSIVFGPTLTPKTSAFPIRDHLAAVFGIEPLLRAGAAVKSRRDEIAAQIRVLRDDLSGTDDAIAAAHASIEEIEESVSGVALERDDRNESAVELERAAGWSRSWQRYRDQVESYRSRTQALIAAMSSELDAPARGWGDDPRAALATSREHATSMIEAARAADAEAELAAARSASAAQLLSAADDVCPTCLRPLTADERSSALAAHHRHRDSAQHEAASLDEQTAAARATLATIARFSDALSELRAPTEPDHDDPGPDAEGAALEARAATQELDQSLGALRERLAAARRQLRDLEAAAQDRVQLNRLAARDIALEIAQRSLTAVADQLLVERVEPLATEIAHRWKLLFGSEGLQLSPDGQLRLVRGSVELKLTDLSGGERATALLISRIILAAAATRASTLWLDEPLEHLDPTRRAGVAQTLVRAAETGTVDQIVVTTYEEGLARRLQATAPEMVQLTYARSTSGTGAS
jgi:DNA repair exonuclease SbcCD ATPase subunit